MFKNKKAVLFVISCFAFILAVALWIRYTEREKEAKYHYDKFLNVTGLDEAATTIMRAQELQFLIKKYPESKYTKELLDKAGVPFADKEKYYEATEHFIAHAKATVYGDWDTAISELQKAITIYPNIYRISDTPKYLQYLHKQKDNAEKERAEHMAVLQKQNEEREKYRVRTPAEADAEWLAFRNSTDENKGKVTTWRMRYVRRKSSTFDFVQSGIPYFLCWLNDNPRRPVVIAFDGRPDEDMDIIAALLGYEKENNKVKKGRGLIEKDQLLVSGKFIGVTGEGDVVLKPTRKIINEGYKD